MNRLGTLDDDGRPSAGVYLFAFATIAAGVLDLIWGEFEGAHQPIGALGDNIPGQVIFAYITALCMIAGGTAILWRATARAGALTTAVIYLAFGMFWLPRLYTAPHALGFRLPIFIGVLAGMFTQFIVVAGILTFYSSLPPSDSSRRLRFSTAARWVIGTGAVLFGLTHLTGIQFVAQMVPEWVPLGGPFWVVVSGIAFLMAGLAILSGVLNVLAARLLALMLVLFEGPVLIPLIITKPHNHVAWGASAYNLAAAGAVWIFADAIARQSRSSDAMTADVVSAD